MDPRRPPQYTLEVFADQACAKDIVKAILHTLFFHRYFTPIAPLTRDLLEMVFPAIDDVDLETLVDTRATQLMKAIESGQGNANGQRGRGSIAVLFFERRRRKSYFGFSGKEEDVCWERWVIEVAVATPRTESDAIKVRRAMEKSLRKASLKIVDIVNTYKDHIPPITTAEANPFPYKIVVNPQSEGWGTRMGIF